MDFKSPHRLGWGFLLAWVFCIFYTDIAAEAIGGNRVSAPSGSFVQVVLATLPVLVAIVTLVVLVAGERRWGPAVSHRWLLFAAPIATAASSPLLFFDGGSFEVSVVVFVAGSLLTGFGSGLMWVLWGEFYARIGQEDVERIAPASAVIAAVLVLVASAMSGWVALACIICLPLVSGACFIASWREADVQRPAAKCTEPSGGRLRQDGCDGQIQPVVALRSMGSGGWGILVACLFVCIEGSFWQGDRGTSALFQVIIVASALFMVGIGVLSTKGPRRISVAFLYRWMCPLLVCGFCALAAFGPQWGGFAAFGVSIAARFAFCLITQMYFARFAAHGWATPTQSYGFGWIFVHAGDFLGVVVYQLLQDAVAAGSLTQVQVAVGCIALFVVLAMFVINDARSFADWDGERAGAGGTLGKDVDAAGDALQGRIDALAQKFDLTPRETEIFALLMRGRSIPYIRDNLVISRETVATHVKHIYTKADVHTRQELLDLAL